MSTCPSRLELSRWEAEPEVDRLEAITSHVGGCARCTSVVTDIESSRSLLLGADPALASARAARSILETVRQRRDRGRRLRLVFRALLVPAAAALLLAVSPSLWTSLRGGLDTRGVKGRLIVETYVRHDEKTRLAVDGQEFYEGDRLRFAYSAPKAGFLLVFGVDDQGAVFPYYDENALAWVPVEPGAHVLLPGAVELDAHQGWERVYTLWSEAEISDDIVRTAVRKGLAAAENDIRRVTRLDLPVEQVSFLLRRP
jgi:hypothetical protein